MRLVPAPTCTFGVCDGSGFVIDDDTNSAADCKCRAQLVATQRRRALGAVIPRKFAGVSFDREPVASLIARPIVARVRDYTTNLEQRLDKGAGLWLTGSVGTGKALANSEPVLTPDGWRPIGAVMTGDEVFGSDGQPHRVSGVYPQGKRDLYRVKFSDGAEVLCDGDHLWSVRCEAAQPWRTLTTTEIAGRRDRHYLHIPCVAPVELPERELPLDPYTLGVLIGDAQLRCATPALTTDREIVASLVLPAGITAHESRSASADDSVATFRLVDAEATWQKPNRLTTILRDLNLHCGSHDRRVPPEYMLASRAQRRALLQGLLDTDGHAAGVYVEFSSASRGLADDARLLCLSLGSVPGAIKSNGVTYLYDGERRVARDRHRIVLGPQECPFRLSRKAAAWRPRQRKGVRCRRIVAVTPAGNAQATCITVDARDGLFVTRDFVLTHNTTLAMLVSKHVIEAGRTVAIFSLPSLLARIRATFDDGDKGALSQIQLVQRLTSVDLLHIDDVGAEKTSEWVLEQLYEIVNKRYEDDRSIVITTNLDHAALVAQIGERTTSRLEEMCEVLPLNGPDARQRRPAGPRLVA